MAARSLALRSALARGVRAFAARPRAMAVGGALTIAFSAILVRLADVSPSTAAIFRCVYALPILLLLAHSEDRRFGPRPARSRRIAGAAGLFLAADLICWHRSIADVGAGLATVFANLQVVLVPFVAWLFVRERPSRNARRALAPVVLGVLLISGMLERGAYGRHPQAGVTFGVITAIAYAGFIMLMRSGGADLRRPAGPLFDATTATALACILAGLAIGDADLVPAWPSHGWLVLLAVSSQVLGWLMITTSLPRLRAEQTSLLLTIQPVGSVAFGALILAESPSLLQLVGVTIVLACVVAVGRAPAPVV
ncbi:MAG: DMT family transporter [Solirubrobacteraceae bacterium]